MDVLRARDVSVVALTRSVLLWQTSGSRPRPEAAKTGDGARDETKELADASAEVKGHE